MGDIASWSGMPKRREISAARPSVSRCVSTRSAAAHLHAQCAAACARVASDRDRSRAASRAGAYRGTLLRSLETHTAFVS